MTSEEDAMTLTDNELFEKAYEAIEECVMPFPILWEEIQKRMKSLRKVQSMWLSALENSIKGSD